MDIKKLIESFGFTSKDGAVDIFSKKYSGDFSIEVDFSKSAINFGNKIKSETKTTQNFSQPENFVVLECVNRLLEKGYKPENIVLEKVWRTGHGTSGRLDILVTRDDGSAFMMIECKTFGAEFNKEFKNIQKNGGQLFTYFQQDRGAEILMLYASGLDAKGKLHFENQIIKIEEDYRQTTNVKEFYDRWNKIPKNNGVFEDWVAPYHFESKALTPKQLQCIKQEDSSFIFNRFLEILRHNVVSDKPNAFNKIFTLFLCKVYDEKTTKPEDELKFQWIEGKDDEVSFQLRLNDLYKKGMKDFLNREVADLTEDELDQRYASLFSGHTELKEKLKRDIIMLRLEKNNEFAIKEVFDNQTFKENAKIVKEVVELLQGYRIRYNKRQQYLSDFFEMLLTTGLKQESGQFFTPVPVAQFVIKSLPLDRMVNEKLDKGEKDNLLPNIIDYAAGSGHFLTESMHEIQQIIDDKTHSDYIDGTAKKIKNWQDDHFDWATQYVYGVEKDYRLVKVGKVGCYLHGDGLANVILSDGLANFSKNKEYKALLKRTDSQFPQENKQFDIVVSNPPYSVSSFKNASSEYYGSEDFELYDRLTDNSSEIECLFIERTKQLLKDGGVAGIILPSSILSNTGIYTKTREIILKYFEIIAIAELGSNTFMATGTNTVTLFLRRRSNYDSQNFEIAVDRFFTDFQDATVNQIEKPFSKYVNYVWEGCSFEDYKTLLQKKPNEKISHSELYKDYRKKLNFKKEDEFWAQILEIEREKILYFILAFPQKTVLVKSGEKDAEKRFLGYEFSNRRGSEGIHPIQRGKTIEECTQLFDESSFENPEKASTYIYRAFHGDFDLEISEKLQDNVSRANLVDMLTFDLVEFEKTISTSIKKKIKIESKWNQVLISNSIEKIAGNNTKIEKFNINKTGKYPVVTQERERFITGYSDETNVITDHPIILFGDHSCTIKYINFDFFRGADGTVLLKPNENFIIKYFFYFIENCLIKLLPNQEKYERHYKYLQSAYIPLPPKDIQQKIIDEIEVLEGKAKDFLFEINNKNKEIYSIFKKFPIGKVSDICRVSNEKIDPSNNPETEFNYLGLENIESNSGKILINKEFGKNIHSVKNSFQENDILYGKLRPYLNKVALTTFSGICSTDILVLKTAIPKILKYLLLSEDLVAQTTSLMKGVSLPRISVKDFLNQNIPLPPLSEQQKIVSEIEKIEKEIADLEAQLSEIPGKKEEILKKYL